MHAQDDLLEWTSSDWLSSLRRHKNEELPNAAPGAFFSFPDTANEDSRIIGENLPLVLDQQGYAYVIVTFKYWDDSMPSRVFGAKELCVFFEKDLDLNRSCGRSRTFLVEESFTHQDVLQ
jgi:hypothetical protein